VVRRGQPVGTMPKGWGSTSILDGEGGRMLMKRYGVVGFCRCIVFTSKPG